MILSNTYDNNLETVKCDSDSPAESDRQDILWELKRLNSPCTSDSVFYEETQFCSKIDDAPFKPCRSVHTISENPAIEIRDASAISVDLPPISWHGYNSLPKFLNISNVGRNVLINGQWPNGKPYIQGGPLNGSYIFSQIHFHAPSEHEIDGKRFPLEMHVVHYKTNYLTQERAMEEKDGTIVLVYLFQVKNSCDTVLSMFIKQYSQFKTMSRNSEITGVSLNNIVKPFYSHYYIYWGSINTMKKSYLLQWIINCSNLYATEKELYDIFHLMEGGNSTGRRVPIMKPLKNTVYYAGGYSVALKKEETTHCKQSYSNEVSMMSQSCQTFNSEETNKKDIQVQVTSNKNPASNYRRIKLCFGKTDSCPRKHTDHFHDSAPYYVLEDENEKKSQTQFESETEGGSAGMLSSYSGECQVCKNPNCKKNLPSESHSRTENHHYHDYCHNYYKSQTNLEECSLEHSSPDLHECQTCNIKCSAQNKCSKFKKKECKSQKKQKKKEKRLEKESDGSEGCSTRTSDECQNCKNLKCTTANTPSECEKKCECHSESSKKRKEKRKRKEKESDYSERCSSQTSDECQTCKNLKCTTKNMPSECEKKCECHSEDRKKRKEKRKRKEKESDCSERCSVQTSDECQTCKTLKCTKENIPSECEKKCECHSKSPKKRKKKKKCKEKESNSSERGSSQSSNECRTCRNLNKLNMSSECKKKCDCHSVSCESQEKPKKKLCFKLKGSKPKKSKTTKNSEKKVPVEESTDSEEKCKRKPKEKKKTKKKKKDDVDCKESSESNSSQTKFKSKSKAAVSDNSTKSQKSSNKKSTKSEPQQNSVSYVLTPFNLRKGPTVPRVLYKSDEKKDKECECEGACECECEKNTKVCNFLVSEKPSSAFASTYRLPQLQTKEPLKEFFLQTEHLFHTEKKGGFSMCTSQDYHVTIVYNQNVLQEFRGTFSPKKLHLGSYERLNLTPVYPEPDNVLVRLEDCFVKMETLNKLYIRAKFLLKQSVLNLSPSEKSGLLKKDTADDEKLIILRDPKTKLVDTQETYLVTFQDGDQSKSIEEFITPKTSMNERQKESSKLIPEKKKSKRHDYEIKLLKKPLDEVETSKSNIFDSDPFEARIKKEKSQKIFAEKYKLAKNFCCRSKKNIFFTNYSTEKEETLDKKTLSGKLKPKNESYPLKKGRTLSQITESLSSSGLAIKNTHFKPFIKKDFKSQNNETRKDQENMKVQPLPKNKDSSKSDNEKSTVLLYYYDPENSKTKAFKIVKSKHDNLTLKNEKVVTKPVEDLDLDKSKASSHKSKLQKLTEAMNNQISSLIIQPELKASKSQKTDVGAILALNSQKTKNKAFPSMIPIRKKRKLQKQFC